MKTIFLLLSLVLTGAALFSQDVKYHHTTSGPGQIQYYDVKDSLVRLDYVDQHGKLRDNEFGVATITFKRDLNGNITEQAYYTASGSPAVDNLGVHKWIMKYNNRSQKIYQATLDVNGEILRSNDKVHHIVFEWIYDDQGRLVKIVTTEYYQ